MENETIKNTGSKGRTIIIIILLLGLIFLLLEIFNFTSFTNITTQENHELVSDSTNLMDDDSCAYYLNKSVEFLYDTLAGVERYKKDKDLELSALINKNVELQDKISKAPKKSYNTENWKSRFVEVEKENLKLISDKYEYDNALKFDETDELSELDAYVTFKDSIYYDEENKTNVSMKVPYGVNYYKDGKLVKIEGLDAKVIFGDIEDLRVKQRMTAETIITEKDNKLSVEIVPDNPDVKITSKETFFAIDKRKMKQLIKKIDPNNYILDIK